MRIESSYTPTYDILAQFLKAARYSTDPLSAEYLKKVLHAAHFIALLDDEEQLMGLSITYLNNPNQGYAYLTSIAVHPDVRGHGYGMTLLRATISTALQHGFKRLRLEVNKSNITAQRLYNSLQFQIIGETASSYYIERDTKLCK